MSRMLIAAALVAAALAAAFFARRRTREEPTSAPDTTTADARTADASAEPDERPAQREWRCACGQEYVVSGVDRHRVYWLAGASPDDPVLDLRCVGCGASLPAGHEVTAA